MNCETIPVSIRWNKQNFDIDIEPSSGLELFQAQLFNITNVPVKRQKILAKGRQITNDDDVKKIKKNQKLMMMGSTKEMMAPPSKKIVFKEDLPFAERMNSIPSGLQNLGNTCYMNSTIQCLRYVPELKESLKSLYLSEKHHTNSISLPQALGKLFNAMDSYEKFVTPFEF